MYAEGAQEFVRLSLARLGSSKWTGNAERVVQCSEFTYKFSTILN